MHTTEMNLKRLKANWKKTDTNPMRTQSRVNYTGMIVTYEIKEVQYLPKKLIKCNGTQEMNFHMLMTFYSGTFDGI